VLKRVIMIDSAVFLDEKETPQFFKRLVLA
jgi:hypothetical protein